MMITSKSAAKMIIDCISDLHGYYPKLEGGDLLILAGDYTMTDTLQEWADFFRWLKKQRYKKKILIAGNHDNFFLNGFARSQEEADQLKEVQRSLKEEKPDFEYLCDSGIEFKGLKIWGSPWTTTFPGMNPKCKAFTFDTDYELAQKWDQIPHDIDILITHSPPKGILDAVSDSNVKEQKFVGSYSLRQNLINRIRPKLHVFGHIHEQGGIKIKIIPTEFVNASYVDERYKPVNKPIRVIL